MTVWSDSKILWQEAKILHEFHSCSLSTYPQSAVCNSLIHWASLGLSCGRWSKQRKNLSSQVLWTWCLIQDYWIEQKTLGWALLAPLLTYYCSKEGCIALTLSLLIKSYELDSKSDNMNQHNFFSPLSLVMLEGKTLCWPCWLKFRLSQSRGRSCTSLQIQTAIAALCLGATKTGPQACEFNPPQSHVLWPWNGISAGQKFTTDTSSAQWNICRKRLLIHWQG